MDNQNSTTTASVLITEAAFQGIGEIAADIISQIVLIWEQILRTRLIVPFLKVCVWVCLTMSVMLFIERVYMGIVIVFVKIFRGRPEKRYKWESIKDARYRPTKVFPARVFGFISEYKFQRPQGGTNFFQDDEFKFQRSQGGTKFFQDDEFKFQRPQVTNFFQDDEFKFQRPHGGTNFFQDDIELGNSNYPMVLVQIPMYNEKEVYQFSIGAACDLSWPTDRIIIQVLDDSTDPAIKAAVESEVRKWKSKGINIKYEIRDNRNGYKAGALKQGMKNSYVQQCDYVAIFDADFQPEPNFLRRTIPFFIHNPEVGLVQARWKFVNANECLMTRFQEMSLDYHFIVEQEVGFSTYAFFGFNGTAGVWRIAALNEAGGWKDRTTVEDMDLAVRASLKGWKFVFVGDLQVKSELPSTFKALRYQQHRWSCGPANLFRKMAMEIITNEKVTLWKKVHVIYSFFLVRKIIAHIISFVFYCVVIPATVFFPEVHIPKWGLVYIPTTITIMNAVCTPKSLYLVVFWITFENVMAMHRTKGLFIGLFEYGRVNEWVVTEKLGDTLIKSKAGAAKILEKPQLERFHVLELIMGAYLLVCGCYDVAFGKNYYFFYLYAQSIAFFVTGFGHIGTFVPNS